MKKRYWIVSWLLVLTIILLINPALAAKEEGVFNGFEWSVENGKLTIKGTGTLEEEGPWASYQKNITQMEFSGTDFRVGRFGQFDGYKKVKEIRFGEGVIGTGDSAFNYVGKNVTIIIDSPDFTWNNQVISPDHLAKIELTDKATQYTVENDCLLSADKTILWQYFGSGKKTVVVPEAVKEIAGAAFSMKPITGVILPQSLEIIRDRAFAYCPSLTQITIPGNVKTLGGSIFQGCNKLTAINFVNLRTDVEYFIFPDHYSGMPSLKTLVLPCFNKNNEIRANDNKSLETLILSEGTEKFSDERNLIGKDCSKLKAIYLPSSLSEIKTAAIAYNSGTSLYVLENSYAHKFAEENGYPFVIVNPIQNVVLSQESLDLLPGRTASLKATIEPKDATAKKVQWMSTNENVATVSEGKIKAVAEGECDIICRGLDCGAVTAICHIVVSPKK